MGVDGKHRIPLRSLLRVEKSGASISSARPCGVTGGITWCATWEGVTTHSPVFPRGQASVASEASPSCSSFSLRCFPQNVWKRTIAFAAPDQRRRC